MAERGVDLKEEKKSYGSVFVIGVALLVALSLWAYWDDNITRRPWKGVQARFYRLDYGKAKAAYDDLFALWKNADEMIPALSEARAEYSRLP